MNQALNERFTGCIVAYRYLIVSEDCLVFENTSEPIVIPGVEKIFKVC